MKSTLNIEIFHARRGSSVLREYTFTTATIGELLHVLIELLKEFSANRGKKKLTLSLTIEKGKGK